jgi:sugar lactone lactonase YvrE
MQAGTFRLKFPVRRVLNRKGTIELFNIDISPEYSIGTRGNGERQFSFPMGLTWDETRKEIFIADTGNDRIVRLTPEGRFVAQHGGFGLAFKDHSEEREDSLDEPYDVAIGGFSEFYVSDQNNNRISVFDSYQSYKGKLYPPENDRRNRLDRPRGIKVDSENNIWVVDGRADTIIKISANGDRLFELGGYGYSKFQLRNPNQIDINHHGEIFIADQGNGRIAVFDRLGSFLRDMKDHLKAPAGVAIDTDGLLIICDDETNEMGIYTPRGTRISYLDRAADGSGFRRPSDLAVNNSHIFLLDSGNHRVVAFSRKKTGSSVPWQAEEPMIE